MFVRDSSEGINGLWRYNHETVAWEEYVRTELRSRVRYNHFIDRSSFSAYPGHMHYWKTNTTYSETESLFHPVITNGKVWMDSLHWEGIVNDTLITYEDSLYIVRGNLSDSALIVNFNILNSGSYNNLRVQKLAGNATYWTGYDQFAVLTGQQIMISRMPGVPQPYSIRVDDVNLRADGAWPHLAMRQRENRPDGISSVRRVLQYTNTDAPSLIASAEQFYKLGDDTYEKPAAASRIEVRGQKVTLRAVLSDGKSMSFRPVYHNTIPAGFVGNEDYAWQMAAMTTPVSELVSEVFSVGDVDAMKLLTSGSLRDNISVSIEEVDPASVKVDDKGKTKVTNFKEPKESFTLIMAQADEEKPEAMKKALYYLTRGDQQLYRLRMKYTGTDVVVFREDLDMSPAKEEFEKSVLQSARIVDLKNMTGADLGASHDLHIFPNPSSDRVTVLVDGLALQREEIGRKHLILDVVNALGHIVLTDGASIGEAVELTGLPAGVYLVRVRIEGATTNTLRASGTFTVVK